MFHYVKRNVENLCSKLRKEAIYAWKYPLENGLYQKKTDGFGCVDNTNEWWMHMERPFKLKEAKIERQT